MHTKHTGTKVIAVFVAVLLVAFVINQPHQAADATSNIAHWISQAGNGLGSFLNLIFG